MNEQSFEAFEAEIIRCVDQKSLVGGNEGHSTNTAEQTLQMPSFQWGYGPLGTAASIAASVHDIDSDGDWVSEC